MGGGRGDGEMEDKQPLMVLCVFTHLIACLWDVEGEQRKKVRCIYSVLFIHIHICVCGCVCILLIVIENK